MKQLIFLSAFLLFYGNAKSQDSNYVRFKSDSSIYTLQKLQDQQRPKYYGTKPLTPNIYRDTRLGSSSPLYNTYIKNHYGAGAVTTNPNKWGSGAPVIIQQPQPVIDSLQNIQSYNERRMRKRGQRPQ